MARMRMAEKRTVAAANKGCRAVRGETGHMTKTRSASSSAPLAKKATFLTGS